jgi:hypothetical protein
MGERERFEAWYVEEYTLPDSKPIDMSYDIRADGSYGVPQRNVAWEAWQAHAQSDSAGLVEELEAAHMIMSIWNQFGSIREGRLVHNFMSAPEDAGEWLEDLGLVTDEGNDFIPTEAGKFLLDVDDRRSVKHYERDIRALIAKHKGSK